MFICSLEEDKNTLIIISKQYIEMLEHNVLEPYKFVNVSHFLFYIYSVLKYILSFINLYLQMHHLK